MDAAQAEQEAAAKKAAAKKALNDQVRVEGQGCVLGCYLMIEIPTQPYHTLWAVTTLSGASCLLVPPALCLGMLCLVSSGLSR